MTNIRSVKIKILFVFDIQSLNQFSVERVSEMISFTIQSNATTQDTLRPIVDCDLQLYQFGMKQTALVRDYRVALGQANTMDAPDPHAFYHLGLQNCTSTDGDESYLVEPRTGTVVQTTAQFAPAALFAMLPQARHTYSNSALAVKAFLCVVALISFALCWWTRSKLPQKGHCVVECDRVTGRTVIDHSNHQIRTDSNLGASPQQSEFAEQLESDTSVEPEALPATCGPRSNEVSPKALATASPSPTSEAKGCSSPPIDASTSEHELDGDDEMEELMYKEWYSDESDSSYEPLTSPQDGENVSITATDDQQLLAELEHRDESDDESDYGVDLDSDTLPQDNEAWRKWFDENGRWCTRFAVHTAFCFHPHALIILHCSVQRHETSLGTGGNGWNV